MLDTILTFAVGIIGLSLLLGFSFLLVKFPILLLFLLGVFFCFVTLMIGLILRGKL